MPTAPNQLRARAMWRTCLASAFRTALACTIVGCATLYGPASLSKQVAFPAFSYVTVILIITDATLGDTLHSCWLAFYATCQSVGPAILSLWLIEPTRLTNSTTALAVALAGFVVALPESTSLIAKRIALGQIVITYVIGFINAQKIDAVRHPVHVAASTALGVLACVLALLLPYPRLACAEVKQNSKLLAENALERLKLYVKALSAEDNGSAVASISQAKLLANAASKLHQTIKRYQESMKCERLPFRFLKSYYMNSGDKLQEVEISLRGMEMALSGTTSYPVRILDGDMIKGGLLSLEEHIGFTVKELAKNYLPCGSVTSPESSADDTLKFFQTLQTIPTSHHDLPPFFFLFCMKLLQGKLSAKSRTCIQNNPVQKNEESTNSSKQKGLSSKERWSSAMKETSKRLMPAFKCSLSLGLAVLFGLIYSKENGFWSGLPVAISLAAAREPTFKVANVKTQGTVLGTVYGVLGCFVFERFLPIRFVSLLPWFIFTSFLMRSKMYGQAGGISAVIGAVLILGRKNFGPPSEFAIARIVETFIGLSSSIMVDLLLQPTRASTLAKAELSKTFGTLHECVSSVCLQASKANLLENHKKLKIHVMELGKFIGEAEVEPNFWLLPFHSACYRKLLGSLSKMVDLFLFGAHAVGFLEQESHKIEASSKDTLNKLENDLNLFKETLGPLISSFEEITSMKSLKSLQKALAKNNNLVHDLEMGKYSDLNFFRVSGFDEEDEVEKMLRPYLQNSMEVIGTLQALKDDEKELKSQLVLSLSTLGYCMKSLIRETREMEESVKELVQWENPSSHVNLHEISCKLRALKH